MRNLSCSDSRYSRLRSAVFVDTEYRFSAVLHCSAAYCMDGKSNLNERDMVTSFTAGNTESVGYGWIQKR